MDSDWRTWRRRARRQTLCAGLLALVFLAVHGAAYWLRFDGHLSSVLERAAYTAAWFVAVKLVAFGWFGVYRGWSRFVTFHDLVSIAQAATASAVLLAVGHYLAQPAAAAPRSVLLMDWGATIVAVSALRSLSRLLEERGRFLGSARKGRPVLIVGANNAGESLLRAIRRSPRSPYRVVGFIAEDRAAAPASIGGGPVLGSLDDTCRVAQRRGAAEVLIAAGELAGRLVRRLIEQAREAGVEVKVLPSYEQLLDGRVTLKPRTVSIEDLLRRDPVELDLEAVRQWIEGRRILVTGGAGSIGSEICRQLLRFRPARLTIVDRSENGQFYLDRELQRLAGEPGRVAPVIADVTDARRVRRVFAEHRPEVVFHAAAYKHVPLMEAHPGEAVKNIVGATRIVADAARASGAVSFVLISTDKAVNPTSVMGACKRVAEMYVQALAADSSCRFVAVRFGNVLDSAGSVVPLFRRQIAEGGPVTVTHPEVRRYFMTIPEAAQLVIQAGAMGKGGEVFVLDMGEPVKILDLARDMIRLSGLDEGKDIAIEFTGLRPGEKLYEELHDAGERRVATKHPKILVARGAPVRRDLVRQSVERLGLAAEGDDRGVLAVLQQIVPRYAAGRRPAAGRAA